MHAFNAKALEVQIFAIIRVVCLRMQDFFERVCAEQRIDREEYFLQRSRSVAAYLPSKVLWHRAGLSTLGFVVAMRLCVSHSYWLSILLIMIAASSHRQRGVCTPSGHVLAWVPALVLWCWLGACRFMCAFDGMLDIAPCGLVRNVCVLCLICECAVDMDRILLHSHARIDGADSGDEHAV